MLIPDVNVLIYSHRLDAPEHPAYADWLRQLASGLQPFALSELVLSGFLRLVTNTRVFRQPTPLERALEFIDQLCARPTARLVRPGPQH